MIEVERVIAVGVVVPFDACKLFVVANVGVAEATVYEQAGDVSVLWSVGCAELFCVVINPNFKLVVSWLAGEVGWFLPSVEDPPYAWMVVG